MPGPTESRRLDGEKTPVTISKVRFEHSQGVLGLGIARPRISWQVTTDVAGWRQAGYEIEVYGPDGQLRERADTSSGDCPSQHNCQRLSTWD